MRVWLQFAVLILVWSAHAGAQTAVQKVNPIAEELFDQGRTALRAGSYEEACKKLAESQRLEPASGTLLNLAVCHELQGKTATAWAEYREVARLARKEDAVDRRDIASERIRTLAPRLSYLVVQRPEGAPIGGLVLFLDQAAFGSASWGTPLPIDPGSHMLEARAPGRQSWRQTFAIGEADRRTIRVPRLRDEPAPARPPLAADRSNTGWRNLGIAATATAVLSAGVGTYFAVRAASEWDTRNRNCPEGACNATAVQAGSDAKRFAMFADGAFLFSVVVGAPGIYLLLAPGEW